MSTVDVLIFLLGMALWTAWIIAMGDLPGRKPEEFTHGSKRVWLFALLIVPIAGAIVFMIPAIEEILWWPPGDLIFSLVWFLTRFISWFVLAIFLGVEGDLLWIITWVAGGAIAVAYLFIVAKRKPTLSGGAAEIGMIILAVSTALLIGFFIILLTGSEPVAAYKGLYEGMIGSKPRFAETLVAMTPFVLMGLAVAVGFMTGLFNIGAEGQFYAGAMAAAVVGAAFTSLPLLVHLPLTMLAAAGAGTIWGAIPGFLKARFGAHEVINTIMMNYIAVKTVDYLVKKVIRDPDASLDRTRYVAESSKLPIWVTDSRLHLGFWIAIAAVFIIWWLMYKTTWGFEMRTVGANPGASRYSGMNVGLNIVLAMAIGGLLSGIAGGGEVLGLNHYLPAAFTSGAGFDSIAVALLAKSNPFGIIPAAFLWGGLRNGAGLMQVRAGISRDLIDIVQALVILFVAAPQIVRFIYRLRTEGVKEVTLTRGWGA
ncbi:MAG: ABC transporter permease [Chloroflexota bacterium]|nr:ABC transporter permease [Chloroflexota bacterium]